MRKYRLAIDYSWYRPGGIGVVFKEIISRTPKNWEIISIRNGGKNAQFTTPIQLNLALRSINADLFWSPGFIPPLFKLNIPTIITIHDLTHLHHYSRLHRSYYNFVIKPLLSKVDKIVTVSDFTKQEILEWSAISDDKVIRIYNGVDHTRFFPNRVITKKMPYILYPGNRRNYKNLENLIHAFGVSNLENLGIHLGITGDPSRQINEWCKKYSVSNIIFFGYVSNDDIPRLYQQATALAFVSKYEGFGLPIIEAMSTGIPVLCSNSTSLPEIAGNNAIFVDPENINNISEGLKNICLNQHVRDKLIKNGILHAKQFSWDSTALLYWNLFEEIVISNR